MSLTLAAVWISFFVCVATVLIIGLIGRSAVPRNRRPADPEKVLAERFARGEIDEIEYAKRLSVLRVGPPLHAYLDH